MRATPAIRVLLVGAFCLVVLAGMLVRHAWPLWTGNTIYLKVRPVDPRDLFRGDYVILGYDINTVPAPDVTPMRGSRQYVQLRAVPSGVDGVREEYVYESVSNEPVDGAVNLAGRVEYASGELRLNYGIDALFVQEGAGREIENAIRSGGPVFAEIAVTPNGSARVRALIIEGQRVP
jgi:uncharacterized membrane-anchored protein